MSIEEEYKVLVIPCSGIGKVLGTIARLVAYHVVEDLLPRKTTTMCLPLLVNGDEEARKLVKEHPCITIDGCGLKCAEKSVTTSRGKLMSSYVILSEVARERKEGKKLNLGAIANLSSDGREVAWKTAEKISIKIEGSLKG